jgi:hypothetical protein
MDRWQSLIDRQLEQARKNGDLSNLPGECKPLKFDDQHTPDHLRMAYKILRDNNLAPDWMMVGKELDEKRTLLVHDLHSAARKYRQSLSGSDRAWKRAQKLFHDGAAAYNKQVLTYNLKVPPGVAHKNQLDAEGEIARALSTSVEP